MQQGKQKLPLLAPESPPAFRGRRLLFCPHPCIRDNTPQHPNTIPALWESEVESSDKSKSDFLLHTADHQIWILDIPTWRYLGSFPFYFSSGKTWEKLFTATYEVRKQHFSKQAQSSCLHRDTEARWFYDPKRLYTWLCSISSSRFPWTLCHALLSGWLHWE